MGKQLTEVSRPNGPVRAPVTGLNEPRALRNLLTLPAIIGYRDGRCFYELSLRKTSAGWLVVAKAAERDGPKVAFINAAQWETAVLLSGLLPEQGPLSWWPDDYPSKWYKESYSCGLP